MRAILLLLPGLLVAQTTPKQPATATKAPATPPKAAATGSGSAPALATEDDKTIYAIGLSIHQQLERFDLSPAEWELVKRGIADAAAGKPAVDMSAYAPKVAPLAAARANRYLSKAGAEPGVVKLPSGILYKELKAGTGPSPKVTDTVTVNYRGTLTNGKEFDSSYKHNKPAVFPLNSVIGCWTEGVQRMKVGGKARLVCPSDTAYGPAGNPPDIPGGATLIFEIELLNIGGH